MTRGGLWIAGGQRFGEVRLTCQDFHSQARRVEWGARNFQANECSNWVEGGGQVPLY